MSSMSGDIPTIIGNANDFENLIHFLSKHEELIKEFGGIKIVTDVELKQSFKKRRRNFPSSLNVQQVKQISKSELIYSINSESCNNELTIDQSILINEKKFWESLCYSDDQKWYQSNVSVYPNQSFYSTRTRRGSFDIHRLPKLSLLKIGGKQVMRHCVPTLLRAHGSGAIYPLSSSDHRLFSIDYHHQGGNRQWYIIPPEERSKLEQIIKDQNLSICLEHQNLLINPSFLDKYHIRYHRVVQHPKEFVVLSAGTFSQGFSQNASWNETIGFALPGWIHDGHANAQLALCHCHFNQHSSSQPIDINQFRYERVQKWIQNNLNFSNNDKSLFLHKNHYNTNITTPIMTIDNQMDSLDVFDDLPMDTSSIDTFWQNNQQNTFSTESLTTFSNRYLPELLLTPISNYSSPQKNSDQIDGKQSQIEQNSSIDSNQMIQSNNINQRLTTEENIDAQVTSFHSSHFLPKKSVQLESTQHQWNCLTNKNTKITKEEKTFRNTLYVSGLRNDICKNDLYRHFLGSTKITIKQHQMPPYLKYAFVVHRTYLETEKNRRRSINYRRLGSECRVQYADRDYHTRHEQQPFTIVVTHIPQYLTENQLHQIFIGCHSLKYYPGRAANLKETESAKIRHKKMLSGYAFIQYSNAQQATNVVENSEQYRINGEPLHISFYTTKRSARSTTK